MNFGENEIKGTFWGLIVGDALGLPVEFIPKNIIQQNPVTEMKGYGTYNQPPGTWSDDTSLTLCLIENLNKGYSIYDLADSFSRWLYRGEYTPFGITFDVGNTTREAIDNYKNTKNPFTSGLDSYNSNGNGSLMRISPLIFHLFDKVQIEKIKIIKEVSSITHSHPISIISCYLYIEFGISLLITKNISKSYKKIQNLYKKLQSTRNTELINSFFKFEIPDNLMTFRDYLKEFSFLESINENSIDFRDLVSDGYVVNTLETAVKCLLNNRNFKDTVLEAVNQGEDTDTNGAVTGSLAGLIYGYNQIPKDFINSLQEKEYLNNFISKYVEKFK